MFGMPARTDYDVNFRLLDVPVRINPLFWIASAFLGWDGPGGVRVLVWMACVFVSILIHEFGHALTARSLLGQRPSVVLYLMGGLCFYDDERRASWKRAAVIAMGPGAGFLFAALILAVGLPIFRFADFGFFEVSLRGSPPMWFTHLPEGASHSIYWAYRYLLFINLFWGLVNLLPIYPLDGGQLANVFLSMHDRHHGDRRTFIIGVLTAGLLAIYLIRQEMYFNAFFVGMLGVANYQLLQSEHRRWEFGRGLGDDDSWRRR